ncbi:MAG: nitroreductase [Muribaculaceae bacterium]|nr:nitroreductase [Muribaculaceae bacterium]
MVTKDDLLAAIKARHSVRNYKEQPLGEDVVSKLREKIEELNREGRLHMQLITDEPKGFSGIFAYGKFSGVSNYVVIAGVKDETFDERVGYYGEALVLYAQALGLNTCWAGLSYKKVPNTYVLAPGEKISCYISIGYGETQGVASKSKTPQQVSNVTAETPDWFAAGVDAALLAPTAVNQQKFHFEYIAPAQPGEPATVKADKGFSIIGYTRIDLGIAKYHFELATPPDAFRWA